MTARRHALGKPRSCAIPEGVGPQQAGPACCGGRPWLRRRIATVELAVCCRVPRQPCTVWTQAGTVCAHAVLLPLYMIAQVIFTLAIHIDDGHLGTWVGYTILMTGPILFATVCAPALPAPVQRSGRFGSIAGDPHARPALTPN